MLRCPCRSPSAPSRGAARPNRPVADARRRPEAVLEGGERPVPGRHGRVLPHALQQYPHQAVRAVAHLEIDDEGEAGKVGVPQYDVAVAVRRFVAVRFRIGLRP